MRTLSTNETLSGPKEDYVRAIYLLQERSPSGKASVTQIAKRLGLSKSTVSERIRNLAVDKLVETAPYSDIKLTARGEEVAKKLTYKHRLIEVWLNKTLKIPASSVHEEAEKLEHAMSDKVAKKLAKFLNHPTADPHGTEISKPKHW